MDMEKVDMLAATKPKSVIIDGDLHQRFKLMCKSRSLKIGGVIEDLIGLFLNNPRELQKMIEEHKDTY